MNRTVSILGCGWLGLPLAIKLVKSGYLVRGSTTTPSKIIELRRLGIESFLIDLSQNIPFIDEEFLRSETLLINIPFRRDVKDPYGYYYQCEMVLKAILKVSVPFVLFVSSTSVYPENMLDAREDCFFEPDNDRSKALFRTENLFRNQRGINATVLRLAGLCGYDRKIGGFLAGRTDLKGGNAPVNLIHRDDCVEIMFQVIQKKIRGETFNLCCNGHPSKKELYTHAAQMLKLTPPVFDEHPDIRNKVVNNEKIKKVLNYSFQYPHPFDFLT